MTVDAQMLRGISEEQSGQGGTRACRKQRRLPVSARHSGLSARQGRQAASVTGRVCDKVRLHFKKHYPACSGAVS